MKGQFAFARLVGILVVIVAVILISLGIFGVFSGSEIKDSLTKVLGVAAVTIVASVIISLIAGQKK